MGLLNHLKAKLAPAKGKVSGLAHQHGDRIQHGIDKAAKVVDDRTKGKYSDRIHTGTDKAKGAMDRLAHRDEPGAGGDTFTPPRTPPPHS
ncbi:antitoxin [Streptomyces sp. NPDC088812]|uniref:antitoxin n=1 Tax=Streptomyces sp. NPDC088812 TaxID=3365905 RepID=UPI0038037BD0